MKEGETPNLRESSLQPYHLTLAYSHWSQSCLDWHTATVLELELQLTEYNLAYIQDPEIQRYWHTSTSHIDLIGLINLRAGIQPLP